MAPVGERKLRGHLEAWQMNHADSILACPSAGRKKLCPGWSKIFSLAAGKSLRLAQSVLLHRLCL